MGKKIKLNGVFKHNTIRMKKIYNRKNVGCDVDKQKLYTFLPILDY